MTHRQSSWFTGIIILLVVVLRSPDFLPSICWLTKPTTARSPTTSSTAGRSITPRWIRSRRGCATSTPASSGSLGGTTSGPSICSAIFVVAATALVVAADWRACADDWAGAWGGIGYAVFVHAYLPGDTLAANSEIFASLPWH